ncbi:hypothetical protein EOM89_07695 [Candidatus Falkowbacteria bacterium]|nr:hypothetical protein [Candidatus Falkowbacteria bacterium]
MTALSEYQRLEAPGLWRDAPEARRQDVIVSFGDATLIISDARGVRALAHWSLPATIRLNPGRRPAIYAPSPDPGEELELDDDTMIAAIEKVHAVLEARRPHPGRLRTVLLGGALALVLGLGVFWMPGALIAHTAATAPEANRVEIGRAVLAELSTLSGAPCRSAGSGAALVRLSDRLLGQGGQIVVLPEALEGARSLPGRMLVVGRTLIEQHDSADVLAGHVLAADLATADHDPLLKVLRWAGFRASFRLLTTGSLPEGALDGYGAALLKDAALRPADEPLLARFQAVGVPSSPYAWAIDPSGESVLGLIEADPFANRPAPAPLVPDGDWVALQGICGG